VNKLRGSGIIAGHYLFIPIPAGATDYSMCSNKKQSVIPTVRVGRERVPAGASLVVYEVKSGDTVGKLAELFNVSVKQICGWNDITRSRIKTGQILSIYSKDRSTISQQRKTTDPSILPRATSLYVVHQGDTPFQISRMFAMTVGELYSLNDLDSTAPIIHPGDTLHVKRRGMARVREPLPPAKRAGAAPTIKYIVATGDNLYRIAQNFSITVAAIQSVNKLSKTSILQVGDTLALPVPQAIEKAETHQQVSMNDADFYTVKHGDNLWRIANSLSIPVEYLYECNGLQPNSVLMPGDTIRFSRKDDL
jgi:LysM repeat protein